MGTRSPLSPATGNSLNILNPRTPVPQVDNTLQQQQNATQSLNMDIDQKEGTEDVKSSPFMDKAVADIQGTQTDTPPSTVTKSRPMSRIISGSELSPLKILQDRPTNEKPIPEQQQQQQPPQQPAVASIRSPLKAFSPIKRFPVKIASPKPARISSPDPSIDSNLDPNETPRATRTIKHERSMSVEDVISHNEGLKHAIEIFEDEADIPEQGENQIDNDGSITTTLSGMPQLHAGAADTASRNVYNVDFEEDDTAEVDDTMISTFSTFSAVPNLTMFSKLAQNSGNLGGGVANGQISSPRTYSPTRGPPRNGPLPNRNAHYEQSDATTNLLEFTEQLRFEARSQSPSRKHKSSNSTTSAATVAATPQRKSIANLLDFDIPPLPTPRSIPSITARELESLKSTFLSEISNLKASLSGKEAEVNHLKTAVVDAEKRVGVSMEQLREERSLREQATDQKEVWERRGREMETVLRGVKEEIVHSQRDKDELEAKLDEMDKRREAAEMMAQEAESKMAGMRAGKEASASPGGARSPGGSSTASQRDIEIAVERVARELHTQYKAKHETKVVALKKSYEARWEKKVKELDARVTMLSEENDKLRLGRDATMTRMVPADAEAEKERQAQAVRDSAKIKELEAEVVKLEAVVSTVKADNAELRGLLEAERVEKGQLVTLAEEMMSMQSFIGPSSSAGSNASGGNGPVKTSVREKRQTMPASTPSAAEKRADSPKSIGLSRPSGLRAPVTSRIGRPGHQSKPSAGGIPRPGGLPARSGIMSSIEKMGNYRGRME